MSDPCGFLLLDKQPGVTSFSALYPIKKAFRGHRVGHAGTLDLEASGLLVVAVGKATRLLPWLETADKTYSFRLHLGRETDTLEWSGDAITLDPGAVRTPAQLEVALSAFRGAQQQIPPAYSALKIDGKRASDRARAGEELELRPRAIEIFELRPWEPLSNSEEPAAEFSLFCHCTKGTYIRSLGRDIARAMGTVGAISAIRRHRVGSLQVEQAAISIVEPRLISPLEVFPHLGRIVLEAAACIRFQQGNAVPVESLAEEGLHFAVDTRGELIGLGDRRGLFLHPKLQLV